MIFISFCSLLCGCGVRRGGQSPLPEELKVWSDVNFSAEGVNRYRVNISFGEGGISGIMMVSLNGSTYKGTVVNEFGIRGFNFICSASETKLTDVMTFIDKWYIRRTIAADLQMLFCADLPDYTPSGGLTRRETGGELTVEAGKGERRVVRQAGGNVTMENMKRNITYSLSVM